MSAVKLNLREMLDIALPAPRMNVINFHILHKLLNAMIEALNMDQMQVELSSSSLIPMKDESTETISTLSSEGEEQHTTGHGDREHTTPIDVKLNITDQRKPFDFRGRMETTEKMEEKIKEIDTQVACLNDYVVQCMQAISTSIGLHNLPKSSTNEAEMAANSILCEIMQSVGIDSAAPTLSDHVTELEQDQLKQWNEMQTLITTSENNTANTNGRIDDLDDFRTKTTQVFEDYARLTEKNESRFEAQAEAIELMDKQIKLVTSMTHREKKLTMCSLKTMENLLEQKVDQYDLENLKEFVKARIDEVRPRPNVVGGRKPNDPAVASNVPLKVRDTSDVKATQPKITEKLNRQWLAMTETILADTNMNTCICSYSKGDNGNVYRTHCSCCGNNNPPNS